jgi:hypothetical protein
VSRVEGGHAAPGLAHEVGQPSQHLQAARAGVDRPFGERPEPVDAVLGQRRGPVGRGHDPVGGPDVAPQHRHHPQRAEHGAAQSGPSGGEVVSRPVEADRGLGIEERGGGGPVTGGVELVVAGLERPPCVAEQPRTGADPGPPHHDHHDRTAVATQDRHAGDGRSDPARCRYPA